MINDLVKQSDYPIGDELNGELKHIEDKNPTAIARLISAAENSFARRIAKSRSNVKKIWLRFIGR